MVGGILDIRRLEINIVLIDRVVREMLLRLAFASNGRDGRQLDKIGHDQRAVFLQRAFALRPESVVS